MHPLDNIIWKALTTRQAEFAESLNQGAQVHAGGLAAGRVS